MWENILASMSRGLTAGALQLGSGIARAQGLGSGRYAALRGMTSGRRFVAGALARGSLRGGAGGSFSRLALAGMAAKRARKRGKRAAPAVLGILSRDFVSLSASLVGLPNRLKSFADGISASVGGLNQFSGTIAISQGQLLAGRIRGTMEYARGIEGTEAYKNRAEGRLEKALLPFEKFAANALNVGEGLLKNAAAYGLEGAAATPLGNVLGGAGALGGGYAGARLGAAAGAAAGGLLGGEGATGIGAAIGSLGGPAGTVLGGIIGTAVGTAVGGSIAHLFDAKAIADAKAEEDRKSHENSLVLTQFAMDVAAGKYAGQKSPPLRSLHTNPPHTRIWEAHRRSQGR